MNSAEVLNACPGMLTSIRLSNERTASGQALMSGYQLRIEEYQAQLSAISEAIGALDPLEQKMIRSRYLECSCGRCRPWKDVSLAIYGDASENRIRVLARIHQKTLQELEPAFREAGLQ